VSGDRVAATGVGSVTEIRQAQLDDEQALYALHLATWTSEVSPDGAPDPAARFFDDGTDLADVLVLVEGGQAIGYVRLVERGPFPSHSHVVGINGLAVAPQAQCNGHGRRLIRAALGEAKARGARKVSLRVLAHNHRARRLYESCGFVVEGTLRREFLLDGLYVDDLFLAFHLDRDER